MIKRVVAFESCKIPCVCCGSGTLAAISVFLLFALVVTNVHANDVIEQAVTAIRADDIGALETVYRNLPDANVATERGKTALMIAAKYNKPDIVQSLLKKNADVNVTNDNGGTALMYAAIPNSPHIINLLLERGAIVNQKGANGWSALMVAAAKGHAEVVQILLDHGAGVNTQDVYGWTPLMRSVWEQRSEVVRSLLSHDAIDLDRKDEQGATALHHAAARGNPETVKQLLKYGATSEAKDFGGMTPIDRALAMGHTVVVKLIQESVN